MDKKRKLVKNKRLASDDADNYDRAVDKSLNPFENQGRDDLDYRFGPDSQI